MTERRDPAGHVIRDLLACFDTLYQAQSGRRYPFSGGRDAKMMKDLLNFYGEAEIRTFMAAFFEMDDPFIEQSGYSLQVFRGCLPKVIQYVDRGPARKATPAKLQGIEAWMRNRASGA